MPRWISQTIAWVAILILSSIAVNAQDGNARVIDMAETLNVRSAPSGRADIVGEVASGTPLNVVGRVSSNRWYQVSTLDGSVSGWVASGFVNLLVARANVPIVDAPTPPPPVSDVSPPSTDAPAPTNPQTPGTDGANGSISVLAANVRASDSTRAAIIGQLNNGTPVNAIGRNRAGNWLQITYGDGQGWVFASLVSLRVARATLPIVGGGDTSISAPANDSTAPSAASEVTVSVPTGDAPYFTLGASARNIFTNGQALGNRANVFSKVGDSITIAEEMFQPFGFGVYNLGGYDYLQPTISYFMAQARNNNSFNNTSLAAGNGYTTRTILDANFANRSVCEVGESPLACEYRLTRPAVALIMLGTNDTGMVPIDEFIQNMRVIADYSIGVGVIPVLHTIPPRASFPGRAEAYNQAIIDVAAQRGLPLIDLYGALVTLPDSGMNADGVHPSSPPRGFEEGADFRGSNLQYGYVMRNLITLQALHVLRTQVLN
ncbi:MAG: SH3 domain-containing protein [Anaerolineae bacterium]